ncbi:MAG: endonuclease/exonuclease/phosphatase family protein [Kiritimatiellia bacterium]
MIAIRMRLGFWGLLGALGFAAAVISLAGFLGSYSWWLEILSHFRLQYALGFLLLSAIFALGRKWRGFAGALILASINAAPVLLFLWPPAPAAPPADSIFRAMLMNVNCQRGDPAAVRAAISNARPDLLVLEEISPRWLEELAPALESYPHRQVAARYDNFGIGLFSRHPLDSARVEPFGIVDVPSVFAELRLEGLRLTLIATHPMPPGGALLAAERDRQLEWLAGEIAVLSGPVLLLGDLNASPWSPAYRRFLENSGLMDSAKGRSIRPTWPSFLPLLWIPLDHALHSDEIAIHARSVGRNVGSDHLPLIVDFSCTPPSRSIPD